MDEGEGYVSDPEYITAKRNYKFTTADNNHSNRKSLNRPKSAKGNLNTEKDLRRVKLTNKDYIDHEKDQQKKKGKYGITVPKPFNFDMREKTKTKSIREKKVDEMIAEKKVEEENIIKH